MSDDPSTEQARSAPAIDAATLKARIDRGEPVFVLDVREAGDFEEWHIDGLSAEVVNLPGDELTEGDVETALAAVPDDRQVVVLCAKGISSEAIAAELNEMGYDATHLEDGMEGWAELYEAAEVRRYDGPGTLVQYRRPSSGCLGYLVHDGERGAVFDPLRHFADRYIEDAADLGIDLVYAVDTHVHADHVSGVRGLEDRGVEGVVPAPAVDRGITSADELTIVRDGETLSVGEVTVEAVHTPGHTTGMTSYLVGESALLTGDGLFVESVARPDLEEGDDGAPAAARMLYESLQETVLSLPDDVVVAPGHFSDATDPAADGTYTATLGELRERMAALSMDEAEFVDLILSDMPPQPANYREIIATNLGQASVDDAEAFQLELGPNNCAASQDAMTGD
ncbi:MAG: MBL fold metallo-hydrolase [Halobacteriales archaeon]